MSDYTALLPAQDIARIANIGFLSRGKMVGPISGRHASPHKGSSVEFAEHRPYSPGDNPKDLDWRVLGKVDRYYVKQYIEETNLRATMLVDISGSMRFTGTESAGKMSKLRYAKQLAAALSYMFVKQQDSAGLVTFDSKTRTFIPARSQRSQIRMIAEALHSERGRKKMNDKTMVPALHDIAERLPRRGVVFIISDCFDDPDEIVEALAHFGHRRNEVILLHVMADEELHFPYEKVNQFRDLEGIDGNVRVDPKTIKVAYLDRIRRFVDTLDKGCGKIRADYVPMNTKTPCGEALGNYLANRMGQSRK